MNHSYRTQQSRSYYSRTLPCRVDTFLIPPMGISFVPIIASLVLPNMTLGTTIWYIDRPTNIFISHPRPYHSLTPVQPVPMTPVTTSVPLQPHQEPALIAKSSGHGGNAKRKESKDKAPQAPPALRPLSRHPRALCVRLLGMPPTIILSFLNLKLCFVKRSLSRIS